MTKVTIKDIAKYAGVSATSVSFAFNNPNRLPEETVQRILEAAEHIGYVPNPVARSMSTGRTGTLGILVPQPITEIIRNPFLPEFLEGVGEVCTSAGFSLMIVPPLEGSMKRAIVEAAVDGFLTLGLEMFKVTMMVLHQRGVPYVMVDSDPAEGVPSVNIDDEGGAKAAMIHILEAGHRNITILGIRSGKEGRYQDYVGVLRNRIAGYILALQAFDLSMDDPRIRLIECASTARGGREGFKQLWAMSPRSTAVVAMSDVIALGVMSAAREAGVRLPKELSVIGFDDIPFADLVFPSLTTVSQPLRKKGKIAADLLVRFINGDIDAEHKVLPTKLIVRKSVAKLGQD
ncbi:MAG: LacI family DNA-binding transcriptional regulator [Anaerolineae bacterium]|nr:MAG: LacI family DNA-binding transcriptional regulator [Anaerolineae bacterium]